jgi:hypothetical protein
MKMSHRIIKAICYPLMIAGGLSQLAMLLYMFIGLVDQPVDILEHFRIVMLMLIGGIILFFLGFTPCVLWLDDPTTNSDITND